MQIYRSGIFEYGVELLVAAVEDVVTKRAQMRPPVLTFGETGTVRQVRSTKMVVEVHAPYAKKINNNTPKAPHMFLTFVARSRPPDPLRTQL